MGLKTVIFDPICIFFVIFIYASHFYKSIYFLLYFIKKMEK